jgi:hypothetical protein
MPSQTKYVGDSNAVNNIGTPTKNANAIIINTGIASPIQAFKITGTNGNLAAELGRGTDGTPGAVETILKVVSANSTVIAYQVDSNSQLSIITERSSDTAATLQSAIQALNANIGAFSNCYAAGGVTVSTTGGIKFA